MATCPRCGNESDTFRPVETGMKVALQAQADQSPSEVCSNCFDELSSKISQGARLRVEQKAREQNKMMIWKSRVNLIRQARGLMVQKAFPEAAVCYEKYLRILEMVYDLKVGELSPKVFNNSTRSKELTVLATVYWDLMRIYDTSPRYGDRMQKCANKLAEFLPFSTAYSDILNKAEAFSRSAKNGEIVRTFLRSAKRKHGRCFVATACFEAPMAKEVITLRAFRDQFLRGSPLGRLFIFHYYRWSPTWVAFLLVHPNSKRIVRFGLRRASAFLNLFLKSA